MSNADLLHVCERGCSPVAKQKGKGESTALITKWNKCHLVSFSSGGGRTNVLKGRESSSGDFISECI